MSRDEIKKIVESGLPFIIIGNDKNEYHLLTINNKLVTFDDLNDFGGTMDYMIDSILDGSRKLIDWFEPDLIIGTSNSTISYIPIRKIVPSPCKCSNVDLMKNGCTCGSIIRYQGGLR